MTEEQKEAAAARMRALRGSLSGEIPDEASTRRNELPELLSVPVEAVQVAHG
jgi:hypothetical protein